MSKYTVEDSKKLTIYNFKKWGYLKTDTIAQGNLTWSIRGQVKSSLNFIINMNAQTLMLMYTQRASTNELKEIKYTIQLEKSPCNLGGYRYWLICPTCYRRVGCLYLLSEYFKCRHCNNLSYESRNEQKRFRHFSTFYKSEAISEKIAKLRSKKYKGVATRQYMHLLNQLEKSNILSSGTSYEEIEMALCR